MPDIAMHLLDIVYNSIRALAKMITIRIHDSEKENMIEIIVEDDGIDYRGSITRSCFPH